jgi:hypothetical protein
MKIKIGKYELNEWSQPPPTEESLFDWIRNGNKDNIWIAVGYEEGKITVFGDCTDQEFIDKLFDNWSGKQYFDTAQEAMNYVDAFLVRMDKMLVFL